ncbi:MAG: PEGA domain-containing protein [Myxococcales bacterium]|nr:PEGA domain-containing protein [Myxococcales bacterium]
MNVLRLALAAALATPAPLLAQGAPPPTTAQDRAAALYDEGVQAFRAKDFAKAATRFQDAYSLDPSPVLLYNLGRAEEEMGDAAEAARHFDIYLTRFPQAEDADDVRKRLAALRAVARGLAPGFVTVTGLPADAKVFIDDQPAGAPDAEGRWSRRKGAHVIRVERAGFEPFRAQVQVEPNKAATVAFRETAKLQAPAPAKQVVIRERVVEKGAPVMAISGWVALGLGAVSLGVAGVFVANGQDAEDDYYSLADAIAGRPREAVAKELDKLDGYRDEFKRDRTVSQALYITGGVLLATGVGLLTWDLLTDDGPEKKPAVQVGLGPGSFGVQGTF